MWTLFYLYCTLLWEVEVVGKGSEVGGLQPQTGFESWVYQGLILCKHKWTDRHGRYFYLYWVLQFSPIAAQSGLLFFIRKIKSALLHGRSCFRTYLKLFSFTIKIAVFQKPRHTSALVGRIEPTYAISIRLSSSIPLSLSKQHIDHAAHHVLRSMWRPQKLVGESEVNNKSCLEPSRWSPTIPSIPQSFIAAHSIIEALSTTYVSRSTGLPKTNSNSTQKFSGFDLFFWPWRQTTDVLNKQLESSWVLTRAVKERSHG